MEDAELTVLALEIMHDRRHLSTMGNIDASDEYNILNFTENDIDSILDEILAVSGSESEDVNNNTSYNPPITIISSGSSISSLPPIPSPKQQRKQIITIPGNKKRGIKRWSKKQKNRSSSTSTSTLTYKSYINRNTPNDMYYSSPPSKNRCPSYSHNTETTHFTLCPSNISSIHHQQNDNKENTKKRKKHKKKKKKKKRKMQQYDTNDMIKRNDFGYNRDINERLKCKQIKKRKKKRKSGHGLTRKRDGKKDRNKARASSIASSRYNDDNYDENEYMIETEDGFVFVNGLIQNEWR